MLKCFEGENTSMCEAIRQMVDEGISMGQKQGSLNEKMTIARRLLELKMPEEQVIRIYPQFCVNYKSRCKNQS